MHSKPIKILAKSVFRVGSWFYPVMSRPQEYLSLARVHQRLKNHIKISVYSLDHKNCMPNNLIAIICLSKVWQPQYVFRRMRWKERKNEIGKKNEMESECKKNGCVHPAQCCIYTLQHQWSRKLYSNWKETHTHHTHTRWVNCGLHFSSSRRLSHSLVRTHT